MISKNLVSDSESANDSIVTPPVVATPKSSNKPGVERNKRNRADKNVDRRTLEPKALFTRKGRCVNKPEKLDL